MVLTYLKTKENSMSLASVVDKFPIGVTQRRLTGALYQITFDCVFDGKYIFIGQDNSVSAVPSPNISDIDIAWHQVLVESLNNWEKREDIPAKLREALAVMAQQYSAQVNGASLKWKFVNECHRAGFPGWYLVLNTDL